MSTQNLSPPIDEDQGAAKLTHTHQTGSEWELQNFKTLTTIGRGNYATVYLVESTEKKQLFAMKVRDKKSLIENSGAHTLGVEKTILLLAKKEKHPFVVEVFGGSQTTSHTLLYLEFCQGGDLMHHLKTSGKFSLERTKFYAAEVTLALKWFHGQNLLYRSLSLDDILLGVDGHIKLVDFVVSKIGISLGGRTKSFCGSAEFMPPEMLLDHPYNSSVDWWQLGIITYQMLTQLSPFRGEDEDEIYDGILADDPLFPVFVTADSIDFVQELLCKDPDTRLGSGIKGVENVMNHSFFEGINWDDLYHKRIQPSFIPTVESPIDVKNFDSEITGLKPEVMKISSEDAQGQGIFEGFEFST